MLPISDYAWIKQQFMQLVSTLYFKESLESVEYLGPHVWYIKENEIKASKTKKEERKNN